MMFIFYQSNLLSDLVETYEFGFYRETTCCVLSNVFFPIVLSHGSAVTAMQLPSTFELCCVFSVVSLLCRGTWLLSSWWKKMGMRPPLFHLKRHSRGTLLLYDLLQRSIAVSAAVAPVATHWGSRFIASLGDGLSIIHNSLEATTDCLGDIGPVRTCHASWIKSSTSNRTPARCPTRNFCKFCTPVPQYPELLQVS